MRFEKWQALGNDYIVLERDALPFPLTPERAHAICDAHFGCHADGILLLSKPTDPEAHVAELRIFNPDGSEAELSGNGAREAIMYLRRSGWTDSDEFTILTAAGEITPRITGPDSARVAMAQARTSSDDFPSGPEDGRGVMDVGGVEREFQHVSVGNPQCAIEVDEGLEELDLPAIGPAIESSPLFPNRSNVSFWRVEPSPVGATQASTVRARIFERGVGETLSSGTGATGAAVAAHLRGAPSPITVVLDGGELLVEIGPELEIWLTGTAEPVFGGEFSPEMMRRLAALEQVPVPGSEQPGG
ncbi:MAG: diaminopimelate epimerase [Solirubrobacterales bacterium]|nr:diaminopimelate epimerase [Solirubrobacterales bacterium]